MSSMFIALPLSSGEAFLLRTPDSCGRERVILVDSGKKYADGTRELAKVLSEVSPKIDHIDFAICTHSDADHSQGFWSFTDDWYGLRRTIGEYWLPGRWANAMPAILTDPTGFAAKLMSGAMLASRDLHAFKAEIGNVSREDRHFRASSKFFADTSSGVTVVGDNDRQPYPADFGLSKDEITMLRMNSEETDDTIDPLDAALESLLLSTKGDLARYYHLMHSLESDESLSVVLEGNTAFQEVADIAKAIRKIALGAIAHQIRVRWFDFGEYERSNKAQGGETGLLEPCCSVEVVPDRYQTIKLSNLMLFHSLRLTRQNVESLVFYRPETDDEPGVLFLGDSRLAHGVEKPGKPFPLPFDKPKRKLLVTAPHHGSRNNDHAYGVLKDWLGTDDQIYIRNGGQTGQTLQGFITYKNRRCAQCVQCHGKEWNQWVAINTDSNSWKWPPSAEGCGAPVNRGEI